MATLIELIQKPGHVVLCGDIDSGKSSYILSQVQTLFAHGLSVSGWITPAYLEAGCKCGHDFAALHRDHLEPTIPFTRNTPFPDSFAWMRYWFHRKAFVLAEHLPQDVDCFVMDEIGPLELSERQGFYHVALRAYQHCPCTVTVLRSGLASALQDLAPTLAFQFIALNTIQI